jgi:HTH-type transcriptional regulator / antitoxin HigA
MTSLVATPEYTALLREVAPKIIRTEQENEAYTEILYELDSRGRNLTLLIENFEETRYRLPHAKPLEALRFLMDQHDLKQKDLVKVFGTASIVSEVLSGKRELNKEHIKRLSRRFHISPELFF